MAEPNDKDAPNASPPPPSKGESLRDRVGAALLGFLLTGVVGTMVATWFQQRGWAWQNSVAQVEKDTTSALNSLKSVSDLIDKRWSATFQMVQASENPGDQATAKDNFAAVNKDWELQFANVDAAIEFNVDRPFGVDATRMPDALWTFQCDAYPFTAAPGAIDAGSAHAILKVIDHCQDVVKSGVADIARTTDDDARKKLLQQAYFRLSNIYYIDDALRCVILERAVAMRRSLDSDLSLASLFETAPRSYAIPAREGDCLAPYREWSAKNPPKQQ